MPGRPRILVIGLGNCYRRDDGVGIYVAEKIKSRNLAGVKVIERLSDTSRLLDIWAGADKAYIIDCTASGAKPGHIYKFDALNELIPEDYFARYSTHSVSVVDAIVLAKTLGELPGELIVYGIEGKDMTDGEDLSPEIVRAVNEVIRLITNEITEVKGDE
jgi:hydrogenase maturation protease